MDSNTFWVTHYNTKIRVGNLSHQHLSNILHYFNLVLDMGNLQPILTEVNKRFDGVRLPYKPLISFRGEIDELVRKGYTTGEINADIIVDNQVIGKIEYN